MTRPITWTDEEIEKAAEGAAAIQGFRPFWREVLRTLGAVHPAEAREQARAAWDSSQVFVWGRSLAFKDFEVCSRKAKEERDRIYPSLLPKAPPPLVLSTGSFMRTAGDWIRVGDGWHAGMTAPTRTASDARALAKWLAEYGSPDEQK